MILLQRRRCGAGDQDAVLVDLAGGCGVSILVPAHVLWQHNVGSDVNVAPAVGAGLVVIMDRGGTTTAFDEATGSAAGTWRCWAAAPRSSATPWSCCRTRRRTGWTRHRPAPLAATVLRHVHRRNSLRGPGRGGDQERIRAARPRRHDRQATRSGARSNADPGSPRRLGYRRGAGVRHERRRWSLAGRCRALTLAEQDRPALASAQGVLLFNTDWTFEVRKMRLTKICLPAQHDLRRNPHRSVRGPDWLASLRRLSGRRWSSRSADGRLRDVDWPYGLRSIVLTGYVVFAVAGFDGDLVRTHSPAQHLDRLRQPASGCPSR